MIITPTIAYLLVFGLAAGVFEVLRVLPNAVPLVAPRAGDVVQEDIHAAPPEAPPRFFAWMRSPMPDLAEAGLDGVMVVRLFALCEKFFLVLSAVSVVLLLAWRVDG